ncbi:MAG: hypothetical protein ACHQ7N_20450 [Candidatus Methylomirabilales bacterium]
MMHSRMEFLANALLLVIAVIVFVTAVAPQPARAAACDEWLGQTVRLSGTYTPAAEAYARPFVFVMVLDCKGIKVVVTVQRPNGLLPVCEARQQVEVMGKLIWNRALVDGHFEINEPSSVTCLAVAPTLTKTPEPREISPPVQTAPPARTEPPRAQARVIGSSVWVGRYQDSRGAGDITFALVRGESTVSGTWMLRTGGGGPVTGIIEASGRRMQLRMENTAPECPGLFEGSGEITDTTLVATYHGKDCQGDVTGGQLELRVQ